MRILGFFCLFFGLANSALAAPGGTIDFTTDDNGKNILFRVSPDAPATGCNFNFFAHMRRSKLDDLPAAGIRIASFVGDRPFVDVEAVGLPRLRRRRIDGLPEPRRFRVFFKLYFTCGPDGVGSTPTYRLSLRRTARGKLRTVREWILSVKNHMRYAEVS